MYTPDADDAANPLLSTLAGTAQAEFQAIKNKMNNLFLASAYNADLNQQNLQAGLYYLHSLAPTTNVGIMYGHAINITRNDIAALGGTGVSAVAAQLTAIQGDNQNSPGTYIFGFASEAWTSPSNSQAILIGGESSVISQYNDNTAALVGFDIVFKNRPDSLNAGSVVQGLGANHYNVNSRALQITSFGPSTAGEFCGWHKGITFEANSMSQALIGGVIVPAIVIDMTNMGNPAILAAYNNPWKAYKHSSALALSEYMSITWDKLQFTRTFLDSFNEKMWLFAIGGDSTTPTDVTKCVGFDYNNNKMEFPTMTDQGAPAAADASVIMRFNGVDYYVHLTAV